MKPVHLANLILCRWGGRAKRGGGPHKMDIWFTQCLSCCCKNCAGSEFCGLRSREAALLETQLNLVHTIPCQAEDEIRLLPDSYQIVIGTKSWKDVCAGRSVTAMIDIIQTHSSSKTRSVILMQGDFLQSLLF